MVLAGQCDWIVDDYMTEKVHERPQGKVTFSWHNLYRTWTEMMMWWEHQQQYYGESAISLLETMLISRMIYTGIYDAGRQCGWIMGDYMTEKVRGRPQEKATFS